ncbi:MAG: hypothetical protein D3905_10230 [Candidatus Electrothrix sp. AS4_5]|nr:hypothetical protein [Candidatus Electrothrix gigas]MCI5190146.1 hypothetical protein [Candidatus Electrothrix gigas]
MSKALKQEFFRWVRSLNPESLDSSQTKLLNLLISHFDTIKSVGIGGGARAHKIGKLIQEYHASLPESLPDLNVSQEKAQDRIDHIDELIIGPFRGFTHKEKFTFRKKYAFLYGPNGSGKSSFCEGLEYALLGDIEEASAKRIKLQEYIRNTEENWADIPEAYTVNHNGKKKKIQQDQSLYRFAFIEKNRIDKFARLAASSPGQQKDRIATLFGLDAFSTFVDGFTENFDGRYILLEPIIGKAFENEQKDYTTNIARQKQIDDDLKEVESKIKTLIQELNQPEVTSIEDAESALIGTDGVSGKINQLQKDKAKQIPNDIDRNSLDQLLPSVSKAQNLLVELENDLAGLRNNSSKINFKDLYSVLTAISVSPDGNPSLCPACKTPLSQVKMNPFANARNELKKLNELAGLQDRIPSNARSLSRIVKETIDLIQIIENDAKKACQQEQPFPVLTKFEYTNIEAIPSWFQKLRQELVSLSETQTLVNSTKNSIQRYNNELAKKRSQHCAIDNEITKYQRFNNRRVELLNKQKYFLEERTKIGTQITHFRECNSEKIAQVEAEKKSIEINKKFLEAYKTTLFQLKEYRNSLPQILSSGLSEKTREYYNIINAHDPEFERLQFLSLPNVVKDKIRIIFTGEEIIKDALHVLSEGHIKVLGLSILLAKALHEQSGFIVFDDVVNAIDDDHRNGIVDLLITHPDLTNKQQIITCHGEQFINKLEHKLGASRVSKEVNRYQFYPVDSIAERGVKPSTGDAKHYLVQAREQFDRNSLKDAATKCRQAVESLSEMLWKKLGKEKNINLTVKMRAPGVRPDLYTVVGSLTKELKNIDKESVSYKAFLELKERYPWSILNKGVHEQSDLPEFERTDINSVIQLIETLDEEILGAKFTTRASTKQPNTA